MPRASRSKQQNRVVSVSGKNDFITFLWSNGDSTTISRYSIVTTDVSEFLIDGTTKKGFFLVVHGKSADDTFHYDFPFDSKASANFANDVVVGNRLAWIDGADECA